MSKLLQDRDTPLEGLRIIDRTVLGDSRGFLERLFCDRELATVLDGRRIRQVNRTVTHRQGALRGLHYQLPPAAEGKFITCLKGVVWDVAVDLRAGSPTFRQWHAVRLDAKEARSVFIPEGMAHGFQTLDLDCEMLYFHTEAYDPEFERGLRYDDPALAISWPHPVTEVSDRDQSHALISADWQGIDEL